MSEVLMFRSRPIKPVALVLMNTMFILSWVAITDKGVLEDSRWADVLGSIAFLVGALFMVAWLKTSQRLTEIALLLAFFIWGVRFWAIVLVLRDVALVSEPIYLSIGWMVLAGLSYLLERSSHHTVYKGG